MPRNMSSFLMISAPAPVAVIAAAASAIVNAAVVDAVRRNPRPTLPRLRGKVGWGMSLEIVMAMPSQDGLYNFWLHFTIFDGSRGRGVRMRALTAVALMAVTTMMVPAPIRAQQSDERRQCFAREGVAPEQKLESCTAVIESGGQTPQGLVAAFNSRGNVHLSTRNYDRAIDDYNEAIRLDPKYAIGFNNRGLAYQGKGKTDRAIEDFDEAIRLNPTYATAFVNRADARRIKGRIDLAIEDSDRAIGLNPNLARAFLARALAYQQKAQWDFDAYLAEGVYEDRAIQDLDEVVRLDPNNATAFRNRGFVNTRRQRYDRAIQDFDEAIRLNPNVASDFSGRAYALRFVGQYERAIADYRKALTLQLDDTNRKQIGKMLKQLGAATERDATPTAVTKR